MRKFKRGDLVSVWYRATRRHKWHCEIGLARILQISERHATLQTSDTGSVVFDNDGRATGYTGATGIALHGVGKWQRELRKAVRP